MSTNSSPSWSSRAAIAALLPALLLAGCPGDPPPPPPTPATYSKSADAPAVAAAPAAVPSFTDVAEEWGVRFRHDNGARGGKFLPETMGSGVAVFDADGDGDMDLFLANAAPWPWERKEGEVPAPSRFFRNEGGGRFADATEASGLGHRGFALGALAGDYDGDGDQDLLVTGIGPCALYRNDAGRFVDVAAAAGVAGEGWRDAEGAEHEAITTAAAWLDHDRDGVLDLYVARYVRWSRASDVFTTMDGRTKAYTIPDRYRGDSGRLYRGRGDGTFEDATDRAGVRHEGGKALGVVAADLDGDGWTDIAVANDTVANFLFRNNGDGTFKECGLEAGIGYDAQGRARADMGIDAAFVDDDPAAGPVLVTGTFSQEAAALYRRQAGVRTFTFVDEGGFSGIAGPTFPSLTFGVLLQDLDLDGRADLVLANGHIEPTIQSVQRDIPYAQRPQYFRNSGGGRFEDATDRAGPAFAAACVGRGLAWGDLDGDGDPDLVITANGGPVRILRNDAPPGRRSVRLRLEGEGGNRDALGAVVDATVGDRRLRRERFCGSSYLSSSEPTVVLGLGDAAAATGVVVRWPGKGAAAQDLGPLAAGLWRVRKGLPPERLSD
jgi:hypothetical protein